jgi:tetratricopeptide (TPR) repeat protein
MPSKPTGVRISREELSDLHRLVETNPRAALAVLCRYDVTYNMDLNYIQNRGGLRIDAGHSLADVAVITEGIQQTLAVLHRLPDEKRWHGWYNAANGYFALHLVRYPSQPARGIPPSPDLMLAKKAYRKAIRGERYAEAWVRGHIHTNFGNCMARLGRYLDAIAQYDQALEYAPAHPMAWGNLGSEMANLAYVANDAGLLPDAQRAIEIALKPGELEQYGEGHARERLKGTLAWVNDNLGRLKVDEPAGTTGSPPPEAARLREYVKFCCDHRLFLNLRLKHRRVQPADEDGFSLGLLGAARDTSPISGRRRVNGLVWKRARHQDPRATREFPVARHERPSRLMTLRDRRNEQDDSASVSGSRPSRP